MIVSRGPFTLIARGEYPTDWFLTYIEEDDEPGAWLELLELVPEFGRATLVDAVAMDTEAGCLCIEHWSVSSKLRVIAAGP